MMRLVEDKQVDSVHGDETSAEHAEQCLRSTYECHVFGKLLTPKLWTSNITVHVAEDFADWILEIAGQNSVLLKTQRHLFHDEEGNLGRVALCTVLYLNFKDSA
jgi:hypothetical protein